MSSDPSQWLALQSEDLTDVELELKPAPHGAFRRSGSSVAATEDERKAVDRCLKAVEVQVKKRESEGLSTRTFFLGVVNSHLVAFIFSGYPQHFWILYMLETFILFPVRFYRMLIVSPLATTLYMLDFCWIANFCGNIVLLILIADAYTNQEIFGEAFRRLCFTSFYAIANGPLLLATGALGNALVFHDMDNTASMFIHSFPSLLMYIFRWKSSLVRSAWPTIFKLDYFDTIRPLDLYIHSLFCYCSWWLLYTVWLLVFGMKLPSYGYDTVFHWALRGPAGPVVSKLTGRTDMKARAKNNDFFRSEALVYLVLHAAAINVALVLGMANFYYQPLHTATMVAMLLLAVYNGAARYSHFLLRSYADIIRRELGLEDAPLSPSGSGIKN